MVGGLTVFGNRDLTLALSEGDMGICGVAVLMFF